MREERGETFYRLQVCLGREVFLNKYGLDKEELYDKITCENIRAILKESLEDIRIERPDQAIFLHEDS